MKTRRHHNNDGRQQIKRGASGRRLELLARALKVPFSGGSYFVKGHNG